MRSPIAGWLAAALAVAAFVVVGLRLDAALVQPPEGVVAEDLPPGERVFRRDCGGCHLPDASAAGPTSPPAGRQGAPRRAGPDAARIAAAYRQAYATRDSAVAGMVAFVRKPLRDASLLPDSPDDTWDRMAPLAIGRDDLRHVTEWMLDRAPPDSVAGGTVGPGGGPTTGS